MNDEEKKIAKISKNYLPNENDWNKKTWSNWISLIVDNHSEFSKKELFVTLRFIITGKKSGPEMSELVLYLGKNKIEKILNFIK